MKAEGEDWDSMVAASGVTSEDFRAFYFIKVEIIDGYHRYGAVQIIKNNPHALLVPELDIDWAAMADIYPTWIKIDRNKKVIFSERPDPRWKVFVWLHILASRKLKNLIVFSPSVDCFQKSRLAKSLSGI